MRSIILTLVLALSAVSWAVNGDMGGISQDGSEAHPYLIEDVNDFDAFAGNSAYWASEVHTKLMTDIDLGGRAYSIAVIAPNGDKTIWGFDGISYKGVFDGNGHSVGNITIDANGKEIEYLGLFGQITGPETEVKNLGIDNILITGTHNAERIGALVGENDGAIVAHCHASGSVSGCSWIGGLVGEITHGLVTNCHSSCSVSHAGDGPINGTYGGLVGHNYFGLVINSISIGDVSGVCSVGGLIGDNQGNLTNCYSTGSVTGDRNVGGLAGKNSHGSIANCYSTGAVNGNSDVGGFLGKSISGCVAHCFWDIERSGIGSAGEDNYGATGQTTLQMQTQSMFIDAGWDFIDETANGTCQIWQMPNKDDYPVLSSFNGYVPVNLDGDGTRSNPYLITNPSELGAIYRNSPKARYQLTTDIDLIGIEWSTAVIPALYGTFDGNGHTIDNLSIEGGGYLGLIGLSNWNAMINNLSLENISIRGVGKYNGGLVAYNLSKDVSHCYTTGSISGNSSVGGLIGQHLGIVTHCYSACSVYGIDSQVGGLVGMNYCGCINACYAAGPVSGDTYVGGLVGWNYYPTSIDNCYETGSVKGRGDCIGGLIGANGSIARGTAVVANCYSMGPVSGAGDFVGGFTGVNYSIMANCFWDIQTSGIGTASDDNMGAIGKTILQMQTQSTFTDAGWDFAGDINGSEAIWWIPTGKHPILTWQRIGSSN